MPDADRPSREAAAKTWHTLELIRVTTPYFQSKGVDAPRLAAEILLAHALGCRRIDLYTRFEQPLPAEAVGRFRELVRRRASREPIQHLTGRTEFWSTPILCDRRALIPRPETELLVQAALECAAGRSDPAVADIGTGTGCVIIALAKELPGAGLVASDVSAEALALAMDNLKQAGLADRVRLLQGDLVQPFREAGLAGCFDVVASNPPYVADGEMERLQPEVKDHDPPMALRGGADGLNVLRRLCAEAGELLKPGGRLCVEVGHAQSAPVQSLLASAGWIETRALQDAAGIERVVVAQRAGK